MLTTQLECFEKNLENAIAGNLAEITFIHGLGNGVLREEIHRRLSKHSGVEFFKDARKEKFGYGATLVRLKA
jgi:dsDNA-specific endonuclease/ATPase MutS2